MDYDRSLTLGRTMPPAARLSADDRTFVTEAVLAALASFSDLEFPKTLAHPGGFSVSGAPVRTFVHSATLLAGRRTLGDRYQGHDFYQRAERDMAFAIMRSNFHRGLPKRTHCCVQCTLAVFPVLEADAVRYFEGPALATEVRKLISDGGWRFAKPAPLCMLTWALGGAVSP